MKFLEVNPYWNVPESIIKKEMMPKLAADPSYLSRMGYQVSSYKGRMVVRQPPGERNALGNIKFMFPNQHAVYLHDTPSRGLFKTDRRAYSHGCVRVFPSAAKWLNEQFMQIGTKVIILAYPDQNGVNSMANANRT